MRVGDMGDGAALLRAILEDPADDAPRLVYADWLDEHGQPDRAEFVRVQCELARLGPPHVVVTERCVLDGANRLGPDYYSLSGGEGTEGGGVLINEIMVGSRVDVLRPRGKPAKFGLRVHRIGTFQVGDRDSEIVLVEDGASKQWAGHTLRERERKLLDRHGAFWGADLPVPSLPQHGRCKWERGFVAAVEARTDHFLAHAAALFSAQPVTRVLLTDRTPRQFFTPEHSRSGAWVWYSDSGAAFDGGGGPAESTVPGELAMGNLFVRHPTRDAAHDALSAACVAYGRSLAGLTPLPANPPGLGAVRPPA